jgi:hypothetical protein
MQMASLSFAVKVALAAAIGAAGTTGIAASGLTLDDIYAFASSGGRVTCRIKGNISAAGERIYHVPGQRYYDATFIDPQAGERWFCSEAEARAAGWRKSKV